MSNNTKAISFWNFLKENTIEIPIIQRDYAQGRVGKENLRKSFLGDLKKTLDSGEIMKLDFVYGSTENDKLNPLDGQQRLTTLWLLHWYIALRAGELNESNCKIFGKFTYETRISSREFCENLCKPEYFINFDGNDIVDFITKQTWFYSAWKQDPTIQSMLRMLGGTKITNKRGEDIIDGIEELFPCDSLCPIGKEKCTFNFFLGGYWEKLISDNAPIVFYHLPLRDFGLSDDLYIKMNARGKQLTSFENFKADLIRYITNESLEKANQKDWEELLDTTKGIPIMLDTNWTDIFWKNKSIGIEDTDIFWKNKSIGIKDKESKRRKANQIDEIYFAFLNRFFWNELFIAKNLNNKYILDIGKGDESSTQENNNSSYKYLNNSEYDNDTTIAYEGLDVYRYCEKTIPISFFQKIKRILNNYFTYSKVNELPECPWDKSFRFIPEYIEEKGNNIEIENTAKEKILKVTTLNQVQRVVFFAICKYFDHGDDVKDSETSLKQWMRVVWNLVSGEDHSGRLEIRNTSAMRTAIEFIDSLNSHNVYESLVKQNGLGNSSFDDRCKEEIVKAKQILNNDCKSCRKYGKNEKKSWEEIIIDAEKFAFFKGAIRFLFTDGEGKINWCDFDTKWVNVQKYFDEKCGVKEEFRTNAVLLRALLSRIDIGENWFGYDINSWRTSLLSRDNQSAIHYLLTTNELIIEEACGRGWITNNDLLKTLLECYPTWHILNNWRGFSVLTRYTQRRSDATSQKEIVVLNDLRNELLDDDKIEINPEIQVGETTFLYGWDINFKYKEHFFRWWGNPNETEPNVYLMEEGWADRKNRPNPTNDIGTDEDKYYCFLVDDGMTKDIFTNKLECIINQAEQELLSLTD